MRDYIDRIFAESAKVPKKRTRINLVDNFYEKEREAPFQAPKWTLRGYKGSLMDAIKDACSKIPRPHSKRSDTLPDDTQTDIPPEQSEPSEPLKPSEPLDPSEPLPDPLPEHNEPDEPISPFDLTIRTTDPQSTPTTQSRTSTQQSTQSSDTLGSISSKRLPRKSKKSSRK